ncbi:MAG: ABC transporter substrate-binding protein [Croceivirga sp.]
MKHLKLALDWTPNTNHIGFFVARALGFYEEVGVDLELLNPQDDNYSVTPAKKVENGMAHMALCPFESIISYRTKNEPFDAVAIATIFQEDLSAVVVLEDSEIKSPKDLDDCSYASYKARYEDDIVRAMIRNDGGEGNIKLHYPEKLGIWNTLLTKKYDSTWIFTNWEGVQAEQQGVALRNFKLSDYNIPYGYSPVIMASNEVVEKDKSTFEKFLAGTKKGFLFAKEHPEKASTILATLVSEQDADINLLVSQQRSISAYGPDEEWGKIKKQRVSTFLNWLSRNGLETAPFSVEELVRQDLNF